MSTIEAAGFQADFETEPEDPAECTVNDQSTIGEAEPGEVVTLTVGCDVPFVYNQPADEAQQKLVAAGYSVSWSTEPEDPAACVVDHQGTTSDAEPGEAIMLDVSCPEPVEDGGSGGAGSSGPGLYGSGTTGTYGTGRGTTGLCNDGTLSDSIGRQGACSHHGGVAP